MNKCNQCDVRVYPQHTVCPLCGKNMDAPSPKESSYPQYLPNRSKNRRILFQKVLLFLSIISSAVCMFVNGFTWNIYNSLWSLVVFASHAALCLIVHALVTKKINVGRKIIYIYGIVSAFLIAVDIYGGFSQWSTTYVIPFLTIAVAAVFTIIAVSNNKNLQEYLGVLIAIFFISLCPVLIFVFSLSALAWTSFIAVLYCLLTVIGLFLFSGKQFKQEMKKRFHF